MIKFCIKKKIKVILFQKKKKKWKRIYANQQCISMKCEKKTISLSFVSLFSAFCTEFSSPRIRWNKIRLNLSSIIHHKWIKESREDGKIFMIFHFGKKKFWPFQNLTKFESLVYSDRVQLHSILSYFNHFNAISQSNLFY